MGTGYGLAKQINEIFAKNKLQFIKMLRLGPRFMIALCQKGKNQCVLKINLYEKTINQDTQTHNEHLARELVFLRFIANQKKYPLLRSGVPIIYDYDIKSERTWYLKDYAVGEFQNLHDSNFLFKESFFTTANLDWIVNFFASLHTLSAKLPKEYQKHFHRHQLSDYLNLINGNRIKAILGDKLKDIYAYFKKNEAIFNRNQNALTHFEPYPVHFIKNKKGLKIIDWENIGWGNAAHDLGVIWLRAFDHKTWREQLSQKYYDKSPLKNDWWQLFKIEIIVQALANLPYLKVTTDPDEKKASAKISKFLMEQIDLILNDKF
jgi:thiamine kinase-like enzyme